MGVIFIWPLLVWAQGGNTELENPLGTINPDQIFARVAGGLSFMAGTLALLFVVLGGYMILTAHGNEEQYRKGKNSLVYAIIGLMIIVGSYQILTTTINLLTGAATGGGGLPSFKTSFSLVDPLNLVSSIQSGQAGIIFLGQRIIGYLVNFLGAAVVVMYIYGGLVWMTSGGREEKVTLAKKILTYATIGAAVVLGSYVLIKFIYTPFINLLQGR